MSFKDQPFAVRFQTLGDPAEQVFEQTCRLGHTKYGLSRPPIQMGGLPAFIRHTPDYLTSNRLVEVKGLGRDQTLKIKQEEWEQLAAWNRILPLDLFIWDSHKQRYTQQPWVTIETLKQQGRHTTGVFADTTPKPYLGIHADLLGDWCEHKT